MIVRFILKHYNCSLPNNSAEENGSSIVDAPFPKDVEDALNNGYVLEDVYVTNEITNAIPIYSNIIQ